MSVAPSTTASPQAFENLVIRASAGTGKTYQLSNRFIALACAGEPIEQILAVTFARTAAGEIVERILLRVAEAALEERKAQELARSVGAAMLDCAAWRAQLKRLVHRLSRLRIGTLDSFFVQWASHFGLELGLPPGWRIIDELAEGSARSEAIRTVLERHKATEVFALLQLLSKGEVRRSVTEEISDAVIEMYALYRETAPAAWQTIARPTKLKPEELDAAIIALAQVELPKHKSWATRRNADVEYVRTEDWQSLVCKGIAGQIICGESTYYGKPIEPPVVAAYQPLIDQARAVLVGQLADQTEGTWKLLDDFHHAYEQLKLQRGSWRFDDINHKLAAALGDGRLADWSYRLDARLGHLLLDEFQDTSRAQWEVMLPLARGEVTGGRVAEGRVAEGRIAETRGSFFCVGDVKQAIYGWRGGLSEIFDTVTGQLAGLSQCSLKQSYRSSPVVIDTVNKVFEKIAANQALCHDDDPQRGAAVREAWTRGYETHTTVRGELAGHCRLVVAPRSDDPKLATLEFAAGEVRRLAQQHPDRSIGVLARRNVTVARMIYLLRNHATQPVLASEEGGNPLTDSVAVQLLLSLLKIADHPGDTIARFHVAESPLGGALDFINAHDDVAARALGARVREMLGSQGYGRTIADWVRQLAEHCDPRELSRLVQLTEQAYVYDGAATTRTDDFIAHVEQTKVEDPTAARVRVMTVHQAKGLQFDIVVLPELDVKLQGQPRKVVVDRDEAGGPVVRVCRYASEEVRRLLPESLQQMFDRWPDQVVHESLCLLYVAMTRAVHALHMIIAPPAGNEGRYPKTFAGVLCSGLVGSRQGLEPGATAYEHGDSEWNGVAATPQVREEGKRGDEQLTVTLASSRAVRRRSLERVAPSSLAGGPRVDLSHRLRLDNAEALARGLLVHAWFESIEWLDDPAPLDAQLHERAMTIDTGALDVTAAIATFRATLVKPNIRAALMRAAYDDASPWGLPTRGPRPTLEVLRERGFIVRCDDALVRGAIDRLVLIRHGTTLVAADVVDFKTDAASDPRAIDRLVDRYRPQLDAYRHAAAAITGLPSERIGAQLGVLRAGCLSAALSDSCSTPRT